MAVETEGGKSPLEVVTWRDYIKSIMLEEMRNHSMIIGIIMVRDLFSNTALRLIMEKYDKRVMINDVFEAL